MSFVQDLLGPGRPRVPRDPGVPAGLAGAARELDRLARADLPSDPPAFLPAAAEWALLLVYRACQAVVYRDLGAAAVRAALAAPCPAPPSPAACYSADLALCVLPDLIGLARGIDPADPLVEGLLALARAWPLSSVGAAGVGGVDAGAIVGDRCLRRLYADRIVERADASRLADPRARDAVREALGGHPELAPRLAALVARAGDGTHEPENA